MPSMYNTSNNWGLRSSVVQSVQLSASSSSVIVGAFASRVHLMSSLPGWACQYYSPNLDIPPFPWSASRVHLMSSLPGQSGTCTILTTSTFTHFCGQPVFWREHLENFFHKNYNLGKSFPRKKGFNCSLRSTQLFVPKNYKQARDDNCRFFDIFLWTANEKIWVNFF